EFSGNKFFSERIDTFDSEELKTLLRNKVESSDDAVIVDGIDMLWTTWSSFEKNRFLRMVEMNTIAPNKSTVLIFVFLKDKQLQGCKWVNDALHLPRVLDVNEIMLGGER